jgi:aldose 1-epimerase
MSAFSTTLGMWLTGTIGAIDGEHTVTIAIAAGEYRLELAPERGGSILRFDWRGEPVMRPAGGPSILDVACFPLVPFSNRIAQGRFTADGTEVHLAPNFPVEGNNPHPLHGFGWLATWEVLAKDIASATLEHAYPGGEWPWPYRARQSFQLTDEGLEMTLSVTNLASSRMPAGLGFHPYFPRAAKTHFRGKHRGEWLNDEDCLPRRLDLKPEPRDWWEGKAVGTRAVDTAYTSREGPLVIDWPERGLVLTLVPSDNLTFTVVYTPQGENFFCVEPVSHMTDAVNRDEPDSGLAWLECGETLTVGLKLSVAAKKLADD